MAKTLLHDVVDKYFTRNFIGVVLQKINGENNEKAPLFKSYLREEYSTDLKWGASSLNDSVVSADIVSMSSELPLKSRGSISNASGEIPKIGLSFRQGEKELSDLFTMSAKGVNEALIASKALDDIPRVIKGIDLMLDRMFLEGLSTGVTSMKVGGKEDQLIRISYGYDSNNMVQKTTAWSNSGSATPITDLRALFDKAEEKQVSIEIVTISKKYLNLLRASNEGKTLSANYKGIAVNKSSILPVPSRGDLLEALKDEFGADFIVIDRKITVEEEGKKSIVQPYKESNVVALPSRAIGRLVYGSLVEEQRPVEQVKYQKAGSYTLVSKFSETNPLVEWTTGQALALPVIDNGSNVFILECE